MGCGSSKPDQVEYGARAARVSKADVTAAEATYSWICKPGSNEWEGEWRSGTCEDAPKEMGAATMLYSLVNIDAPAAAAPAAAPASDSIDMKGLVSGAAEELVSGAAEMAGMGGAAELIHMGLEGSNAAKDALTTNDDAAKDALTTDDV